MSTEPLTMHVLIEGKVQGVGYRAWCADAARSRDLSGWVRNLASGAVEAVISGPADQVVDMMDAIWQGPSFARVASVRDLDPVEALTGAFEVRDTA